MVSIRVRYEGDLHCEAQHGPSGSTLATDAPVDNHGRGESFSPTDLVAAALGSCMLTVMGIRAQALGLDMTGASASIDKDMASAPIRRIGRLSVTIRVPHDHDAAARAALEHAALTCPVHQSLHPDTQMPVRFEWGASSQ